MSNESTEMSESRETRTEAAAGVADRYLARWNEPAADRCGRTIAEIEARVAIGA